MSIHLASNLNSNYNVNGAELKICTITPPCESCVRLLQCVNNWYEIEQKKEFLAPYC